MKDEVLLLGPEYHPSATTVIVGRGKRVTEHAGNVRFRRIIEQALPDYSKANSSKAQKSIIIGSVLTNLCGSAAPEPAFVKQQTKAAGGRWFRVKEQDARVTIAQAFRDALHHTYSSSRSFKKFRRQQQQNKTGGSSNNGAAATGAVAGVARAMAAKPVASRSAAATAAPMASGAKKESRLQQDASGEEDAKEAAAAAAHPNLSETLHPNLQQQQLLQQHQQLLQQQQPFLGSLDALRQSQTLDPVLLLLASRNNSSALSAANAYQNMFGLSSSSSPSLSSSSLGLGASLGGLGMGGASRAAALAAIQQDYRRLAILEQEQRLLAAQLQPMPPSLLGMVPPPASAAAMPVSAPTNPSATATAAPARDKSLGSYPV